MDLGFVHVLTTLWLRIFAIMVTQGLWSNRGPADNEKWQAGEVFIIRAPVMVRGQTRR